MEASQIKNIKSFRNIRANWYEKGKFYKLGNEYAGVYTPPVEIPESVGGCLAPDVTHGTLSFERWSDKINEGRGGWWRECVFFKDKSVMDEYEKYMNVRYDNTPNAERLINALRT